MRQPSHQGASMKSSLTTTDVSFSRLISPSHWTRNDIEKLCNENDLTPEDFFKEEPVLLQCKRLSNKDDDESYMLSDVDCATLSPALRESVMALTEKTPLPVNSIMQLIVSPYITLHQELPATFSENKNQNVLCDIQCPSCGESESFLIDTLGIPAGDVDPMMSQSGLMRAIANGDVTPSIFSAEYDDNGTEDVAGDSEFHKDGDATCLCCQHEGKLAEFYTTHPQDVSSWTTKDQL